MDVRDASGPQSSINASDSSNNASTRDINEILYDDDSDKCNIRFFPPAFLQRYSAVVNVLSSPKYRGKIRKVVDFGCSELGFFLHLKNISEIEEILCVDIDERTLDCYKKKIEALSADFLHMRDRPLTATIFKGSVTDRDKHLENTDAVIAIELIEHLYQETLCNVPQNIFGFIKPRVAIVTTPNADFNVLFPRMTGFRHSDHKFEWTRKQFEEWGRGIVAKYPEYEVTFEGICAGPKGTEELGCCSQMAVFHRHTDHVIKLPGIEGLFKLIAQEKYPVKIDNRSDDEKIIVDASYFIRSYQINNDAEEMPLKALSNIMDNIDVELLKQVLVNGGWEVNEREDEGLVVVCRPLSIISEDDQTEDDDDDVDDDRWNDDNFDYDYDDRFEDDFDDNQLNSDDDEMMFDETSDMDIDIEEIHVNDVVSETEVVPVVDPADGLTYSETFDGSGSWRESQEVNSRNNLQESENNSRINIQQDSNDYRRDLAESLDHNTNNFINNPDESLDESRTNLSNNIQVGSMASIFLEASSNNNSLICPENITNPNFEISAFNESSLSNTEGIDGDDEVLVGPQLTSTPQRDVQSSRLKQVNADEKLIAQNNRISLLSNCLSTAGVDSRHHPHASSASDAVSVSDTTAPQQRHSDPPNLAQSATLDAGSSNSTQRESPGVDFLDNALAQSHGSCNVDNVDKNMNNVVVKSDFDNL